MSNKGKYIIWGIIGLAAVICISLLLANRYVTAFASCFYCVVAFYIGHYFGKMGAINDEIRELKVTVDDLKRKNWELVNEVCSLENGQTKATVALLVKAATENDKFAGYSEDELTEIFEENLPYLDIETIDDLLSSKSEKYIKICMCANKGLLDIHSCWTSDDDDKLFRDDRLYRISIKNRRIYLSDEQVAMMKNKDFDFILKTIHWDDIL